MKVKELKKLLSKFDNESEVYVVINPDDVEDGMIEGLSEIADVMKQSRVYEDGMDWGEDEEVLLFLD